MNTHIHIILNLNPDSTLSKFMKQLNLMYFHYYRKKYGYFGHFWQDRFKSNIIDKDSYLLQCGKYIELNPVRAGIVNHPEEYLFSSYNCYSNSKSDELITLSPAYLGLSDSAQARQKQYIDFVVDSSMIK
jgi:putative transposase